MLTLMQARSNLRAEQLSRPCSLIWCPCPRWCAPLLHEVFPPFGLPSLRAGCSVRLERTGRASPRGSCRPDHEHAHSCSHTTCSHNLLALRAHREHCSCWREVEADRQSVPPVQGAAAGLPGMLPGAALTGQFAAASASRELSPRSQAIRVWPPMLHWACHINRLQKNVHGMLICIFACGSWDVASMKLCQTGAMTIHSWHKPCAGSCEPS